MSVIIVNSTSLDLASSGQYTDCVFDPPVITYPNDSQVLRKLPGEKVVIGWEEVTGADFYILHLSFNRDFRGPTVKGWKITTAGAGGSGSDAYDFSKELEVGVDLRQGYVHYVRVFAYSDEGCSSIASETVEFELGRGGGVESGGSSSSESGSSASESNPPTETPTATTATEDPCNNFDCGKASINITLDRDNRTYNNQFDTKVVAYADISVILPPDCPSYAIEWYSELPGYEFWTSTGSTIQTFTISPNVEVNDYDIVCRIKVGNVYCSDKTEAIIVGEDPESGASSSGACVWTLANGCYKLAQIVDEQDDCYVIEPLFIKIINGLVYVGNDNCSEGNGC